jgi:hypothetical protein
MSEFREELSDLLSKECFRIDSLRPDREAMKAEVFELTMKLVRSMVVVYLIFSDDQKKEENDPVFMSIVGSGIQAEIKEARQVKQSDFPEI